MRRIFRILRRTILILLLVGAILLLGFFFLIRSLFANWLGVSLGIASISNSVNIGLFGLLWAISALCVAALVFRLAEPRNR